MEFSVNALFLTIIYFAILILYCNKKGLLFPQQQEKPLLLPLIKNWPIVYGVPIFAIINGLVLPKIGNMSPFDYVIAGELGPAITILFYDNWQKNPDRNWGCIIDKNGWNTGPGWLHGIYMSLQVPVLYLFIRVHMEGWRVITVSALFIIFIGLVNLLAEKFQGGLSKWQLTWQTAGTIIIAAIKLW
jgi:hypothetical protein